MPSSRFSAVGLVVVLGLLAACTATDNPFGGVMGEGDTERETRAIDAFERIEAGGGIQVVLTVGEDPALVIEAQPNLLPIIVTEVEGDTLRIHGSESYTATRPIRVTVSTPTLTGIVIDGGANGDVSGLDESSLEVEVDGGAQLTAAGAAHDLELTTSGGAQVHLDALDVAAASVEITGGARAELLVSDEVTGEVSGGGRLTVAGPASVDVEASGGGTVVTP